ncbi:glycoprotein precursor [Kiborgoch virus]|uniref:Envelopment polyprotein n=1 Tax=Kiborgoch virus TaxID=2767009 RepID=A0A7G8PYK3_9VIRU|nr:glycoprotein precursor [Kiborgoch virus]QNJ99609.1 glycoprotein precursor [Kiborgoch virus]
MLYTKVLITSCLVQQVFSKFLILSELRGSTREPVCLSSSTDFGQLIDMWDKISKEVGIQFGTCVMGTLETRNCSLDLMSNYVATVHASTFGVGAMMVTRDESKRVEVLNDMIPDSLDSGFYNCSVFEKEPFWRQFLNKTMTSTTTSTTTTPKPQWPKPSIQNPIKLPPQPGLLSVVPQPQDFSAKIKSLNEDLTSVRKALEREKENHRLVIDESRKKMRELEDNLRGQWEEEKARKDILAKTLEREAFLKKEAEEKAHELDKALKESRREFGTYKENARQERERERLRTTTTTTTTLRPTTTTKATLIITSLLAASVATVEIENLETNHIMNRPGTGAYSVSDNGMTEATCLLKYGERCMSWEYQVDPLVYPFFMSNYEKYSVLEAAHDASPIITKESAVCILSNTSGGTKACAREANYIKKHCSNDMRAYFMINLVGKLLTVGCNENHILSEDCNFCVPKAKGSQTIFKPIQDAVCQKDSAEANVVVRYSKDVCAIGPTRIKTCNKGVSKHERMGFVILNNKKIYVEEMRMRSRQEYHQDQFMCFKIKDGSGNPAKFERVDVTKCKGFGNPGSLRCNGDEYYCNKYPCDTGNPEATCSLRKHSAIIEVNIGGVWVKPKCVGYEMVLVKRTSVKSEDISTKECTTCLWDCGKGEITIKTHGPKIVYATACSHGTCRNIVQKPSTFVHLLYPGNSEIIGGKIGIHMTEESSPSNLHLEINCEPKDSCDVSDCIFCAHGLLNYQCHSLISALIISTMCAGLISLIIFLLSKARKLMSLIIPTLAVPIKWGSLFVMWVVKKWKNRVRGVINATNNAIGWEGRERNIERVERGLANGIGYNQVARYTFYGASILSLITVVSSCSENVIADSKIMQCVGSTSKTTCKATGTLVMKLGPIGSESCLLLKGLRENEKQFISVKTESSELVCHEGESYWTSLYSPVCLSSRRCHLMGDCRGDTCLSWKANKTSAEFAGRTHLSVINENKCFEQSGGMGYGCFNINPSCLYVHTYLRSVYKNGFRIFRCVNWSHRVRLTITTHGKKFQMVLAAMSTQPADWGSIGLILDSESITGTNAYTFMRHGSGAYAIIDDPYSPEPRKGFLGEVRCPTEEAAVKASSTCKVAPALVEYQPELDTVECITNMIDPMTLFNRGSLPQVREGKTFTQSIEKNSIQAMTTGEIRASIRMVLDEYEVEFLNTPTDCDATFVNITGCYSCDEGARVCVQVKATADSIFHFLNKDLDMNLLYKVGTTQKVYCSTFHFSKPVISIEGSYDCGSSAKPMMIKGTLVAIAPHDDKTTQGGSSIVINPKRGSLDFFGWLSGFASWFGGPLKAILTVIGFLIAGLILLMTILFTIKFGVMQLMKRKKLV